MSLSIGYNRIFTSTTYTQRNLYLVSRQFCLFSKKCSNMEGIYCLSIFFTWEIHPTNRWCYRIRSVTNCTEWRPAKPTAHSDSSPAMGAVLAWKTGQWTSNAMLYDIVNCVDSIDNNRHRCCTALTFGTPATQG